jgi:hypothetical protein
MNEMCETKLMDDIESFLQELADRFEGTDAPSGIKSRELLDRIAEGGRTTLVEVPKEEK